eukprot:TRINITY_DN6679_c0_g1_i1.p1 TRINITY_DN6679_c0_g1~~TRINITY_DN6679_c0_g1_i1.p1  ORF type:complete len:185 (+),score=49.74 TRINITY_DN6679_c0_g1_i1:35-556(+)
MSAHATILHLEHRLQHLEHQFLRKISDQNVIGSENNSNQNPQDPNIQLLILEERINQFEEQLRNARRSDNDEIERKLETKRTENNFKNMTEEAGSLIDSITTLEPYIHVSVSEIQKNIKQLETLKPKQDLQKRVTDEVENSFENLLSEYTSTVEKISELFLSYDLLLRQLESQ